MRQRERGVIGKELEQARRRIAAVIKELQGANSLPLAGKVRKRLDEVTRQLLPDDAQPAPPSSEPLRPEALKAGDAVLVHSLNRVGSFTELLRGGRKARVSMGTISLEVNVEDLAPAPRPGKSTKTGKAGSHGSKGGAGGSGDNSGTDNGIAPEIGFVLPGPENTLDLRGLRLSAALQRVEEFCDLSVVKYISPVLLIHGHGTGKLKAGVRDWLGASAYVSGFRPGAGGEGWDGVTVVALNL
jgi:DNA mismatch repair protein MutS2